MAVCSVGIGFATHFIHLFLYVVPAADHWLVFLFLGQEKYEEQHQITTL
jgi:hypothetical protein